MNCILLKKCLNSWWKKIQFFTRDETSKYNPWKYNLTYAHSLILVFFFFLIEFQIYDVYSIMIALYHLATGHQLIIGVNRLLILTPNFLFNDKRLY